MTAVKNAKKTFPKLKVRLYRQLNNNGYRN